MGAMALILPWILLAFAVLRAFIFFLTSDKCQDNRKHRHGWKTCDGRDGANFALKVTSCTHTSVVCQESFRNPGDGNPRICQDSGNHHIFFFDPYFFFILSSEEIAAFLAALWLNIFLIPILFFFWSPIYFFFDPYYFFFNPPPETTRVAAMTLLWFQSETPVSSKTLLVIWLHKKPAVFMLKGLCIRTIQLSVGVRRLIGPLLSFSWKFCWVSWNETLRVACQKLLDPSMAFELELLEPWSTTPGLSMLTLPLFSAPFADSPASGCPACWRTSSRQWSIEADGTWAYSAYLLMH